MTSGSFLTVDEIASQLKVHKALVYQWVHEGRLRASFVGPRTIRVPSAEVDRFVAAGVRTTASASGAA